MRNRPMAEGSQAEVIVSDDGAPPVILTDELALTAIPHVEQVSARLFQLVEDERRYGDRPRTDTDGDWGSRPMLN